MSNPLLNQITQSAKDGQLTLEQIIQAYNQGQSGQSPDPIPLVNSTTSNSAKFNLNSVASYIGGMVVLLGISIVIGISWADYSSPVKVLLTLGLGLSFFVLGNLIALKLPLYNFLANTSHFIGGLLIPTGVVVFLSLLQPSSTNSDLILGLTFCALGTIYLLSDFIFKKGLPILIATGYLTAGFWSFYNLIISNFDASQLPMQISSWTLLFTGLIYLLVALALWSKPRRWFTELCLVGGSLLVGVTTFWLVEVRANCFSSSATICNYTPNPIPEIIYGIIFVPFFILASKIHSRWLLLLTTFGTLVWLIYLNSRYFLGRVNFGVGLIVSGLIIILGSLGAIELNKRLNKQKQPVQTQSK